MALTTGMTGMPGHGFYDRNSAPQWASIAALLPWLEEAVAGMALADPPAVLCQAFPRPDPRALADAIYGRAERLLQAHPERYPFRYVSVAMLLTRSPAR